MSEDVKNRREAIGALAAGASVLVAGSAAAQQNGPQEPIKRQLRSLNTARAVMPDGSVLDRKMVLSKLGLDPNTPPDAWLTIAVCGSNASALKGDQIRTLVRSKKLNPAMLDAATKAKAGL